MTQSWDPKSYSRDASFVASYGVDLLSMLEPSEGCSILDLGCGDGVLTEKLLELGWAVTGIDSSEEQVAAAINRGINALVMDGEDLKFAQSFDHIISNAALHWMQRPEKVLDGVWAALKAGGSFIGEMGGYGNVKSVVNAASDVLSKRGFDAEKFNPWYFPSVEDYSKLLEAKGFVIEDIYTFNRPTALPGDIYDWLAIFAQSFTAPIEQAERGRFYCEMRDCLRGELLSQQNKWVVDYVRLRFKACRPKNEENYNNA